jgi:uncharacterized protein
MNLRQTIKEDLNKALKNSQKQEMLVLRGVLACIQNKEKERAYKEKKEQVEITDEEVLNIIFSEAKKREEAIEEFKKGNRQDLVEKEEKENEILTKYLPQPLLEQEIKDIIKKAIEKTGAKERKDMKKVIEEVMPNIKNRARTDKVNRLIMEMLCQ